MWTVQRGVNLEPQVLEGFCLMTRGRLLRDSNEAEALVILEALRIFSFISRKIDCGERFLQRYFLGKPRCKKAVEAPICLKRDQVFGF